MKHQKRFTSREKETEQHAALQQNQQQSGLEFSSVEQMLRHDALHTPVPPNVAHRLQQSIGQSPPQTRSWWKRLFGR
jgi:hypothetical protein